MCCFSTLRGKGKRTAGCLQPPHSPATGAEAVRWHCPSSRSQNARTSHAERGPRQGFQSRDSATASAPRRSDIGCSQAHVEVQNPRVRALYSLLRGAGAGRGVSAHPATCLRGSERPRHGRAAFLLVLLLLTASLRGLLLTQLRQRGEQLLRSCRQTTKPAKLLKRIPSLCFRKQKELPWSKITSTLIELRPQQRLLLVLLLQQRKRNIILSSQHNYTGRALSKYKPGL